MTQAVFGITYWILNTVFYRSIQCSLLYMNITAMYNSHMFIRVITIGKISCQVLDGYRGLLNFYKETSVNCLIQIRWVILLAGVRLYVTLTASQLLVWVFPKKHYNSFISLHFKSIIFLAVYLFLMCLSSVGYLEICLEQYTSAYLWHTPNFHISGQYQYAVCHSKHSEWLTISLI